MDRCYDSNVDEFDGVSGLADGMDSLDANDIDELMSGAEGMETLRDIDAYRQSVLEGDPSVAPDPEKEWKTFRRKHIGSDKERVHILSLVLSAVGAAAAIAILFFIIKQPAFNPGPSVNLYTASEKPRDVMILTEEGKAYSVQDSVIRNSLKVNNVKNELSYKGSEMENEEASVHTLITPEGVNYKITLDDGTEVWVNSSSKLTYPTKFSGSERVVSLIGEAFFVVARDTSKKFVVHCGGIRAEVFGTAFNIRNYSPDDMHVTLVSGKLSVTSEKSRQSVMLTPGKDASMNGEGLWNVTDVDTDNYSMWHNGYLYFDNQTLSSVMRKIGEWYNVNVIVTDTSALDLHVRFMANRRDSLPNTLRLLNSLEKIKVTMNGNTIYVRKRSPNEI
jgi:transmembrane sensor